MNARAERARRLAVERYDFLWHLASYGLVMAVLVGIWAFEWFIEGIRVEFWPIYPMVIWGIFVFIHYLSAYHEERAWIEAETERILRNRG